VQEGHTAGEALRGAISRHTAGEGPSEDGWDSQVKEKRVWVDVRVGQGWAEPQCRMTEPVPVRNYLAEQNKGTADKNMTGSVQKIIVNTCSGKISVLNLVCLIYITTKAFSFFLRAINTFSF